MTARADDGAGKGARGRVGARDALRLLTRPGAFGRISRAVGYLWRYGPQATRRMLLLQLGVAPAYRDWIATYDTIRPEARVQLRRRADRQSDPPLISLLAWTEGPDARDLAALVAAAQSQLYPHWELVVGAPPESVAALQAVLSRTGVEPRLRFAPGSPGQDTASAALDAARGAVALFCPLGAEPREHALLLIAERLAERPGADIVYWDEDEIGAGGERRDPWFKSDWNLDLHLAQDLFGGAAAFRMDAVRACGGLRAGFGPAAVFDLGLRLLEQDGPDRIEHIAHVLFHRRGKRDGSGVPAELEARRRAVEEHVRRKGVTATVTVAPATSSVRVGYAAPAPEPMVSIIIPTTDRIDLLAPCLAGLLTGTRYDNFEVIIVDCASREAASLAWLEAAARDPRIRVLRREGLFNYSAANNIAARQARGDILLLLNNDTEVIRPEWLAEMVANLQRPEVGAVGAKLLYLDGGVQHAGMCFQEGETLHAGLGLTREDRGYRDLVVLPRNVSAVTGACLALRRQTFEDVGGLDENLRVAFNDVDLCLRIRQRGYLILWTPHVELFHHESATGGLDRSLRRRLEGRRERRVTQRRWASVMRSDPFHSPNVTVWDGRVSPKAPPPFGPGYGLAFPPRSARPW